ncbi:MAG: prolyl oligopeptidase family serine peptidase [Oligoflexia bacterium]|nr:prolyl oligopeptidase family serine peptidase [Oligoflexia bacterium]
MFILSLLLTVAAIAEPLPKIQIHQEKTTVSGISSGAFMAIQTHIALSNIITGSSAIAGGPFWCSKGSLEHGISHCMSEPEKINTHELLTKLRDYEKTDLIAPTQNLRNDKILLLHGEADTVVKSSAVEKTKELYQALVDEAQITTSIVPNMGHGFPTKQYGNKCNKSASPWINQCGFSAAEKILTYFYGSLPEELEKPSSKNLKIYNFTPIIKDSGIAPYFYLYLPKKCANTTCALHIAFHGCQMSPEFIGTKFVKNAGYNAIAESLGVVILYPQILKTSKNPNGCWDWLGYTDENFATNRGKQIQVIQALLNELGLKNE